MISRSSSVMNSKNFTTWSGSPLKRLRNSGSWVATPTGQVFIWHLRIMIQPSTTSAAVAIPHSSAPNNVAMAISLPVFIWPSTCTTTRDLKLLLTKVWCVSAKPNSHGKPVCLIELKGDAPVPPSNPAINMTSAFALVTPAAMVPTPALDTNFTLILAALFAFFKSKINCDKSSIE